MILIECFTERDRAKNNEITKRVRDEFLLSESCG